jgi:alpha-tubulin suppressor-like RCC1 family protein
MAEAGIRILDMPKVQAVVQLLTLAIGTVLVACDSPTFTEAELLTWQALAVGEDHACAVDGQANVYCWGSNERQQLSAPTGALSAAPTLSIIGGNTQKVTAGSGYSCGIHDSGEATCWGDGRIGQLGFGVPLTSGIGVSIQGGPWTQLSAGPHHACGINAGGSQCWGGDRYGASFGVALPVQARCTNPATNEMWWCALDPETVPLAESMVSVSAGLWHSCGVSAAGSVYCWGQNSFAQLGFAPSEQCRVIDPVHGDSFFPCAFTPQTVPLPGAAVAVDAGANHSCAVLADGSVYCWGGVLVATGESPLYSGQLGDGRAEGSQTPVRVASTESFVSVSTSRQSIWTAACGLTADGRAFCWGSNRSGALGGPSTDQCDVGGTIDCSLSPVAVESETRFTTLEVGEQFACGLTVEGQVLCWGLNDKGQLGDGSVTTRRDPQPVVGTR